MILSKREVNYLVKVHKGQKVIHESLKARLIKLGLDKLSIPEIMIKISGNEKIRRLG